MGHRWWRKISKFRKVFFMAQFDWFNRFDQSEQFIGKKNKKTFQGRAFYRGADCCVLVYDITRPQVSAAV